MQGETGRTKHFTRRAIILGGAQTLLLAGLAGRMYQLQVLEQNPPNSDSVQSSRRAVSSNAELKKDIRKVATGATEPDAINDPPAYRRVIVELATPAADVVRCRSYTVAAPDPDGFLPSPAYRDTMVRGAERVGLPAAYVARLAAIPDNGRVGGGPQPHPIRPD